MHTYYEMKLWSDYERTRLCETIMSGINVQLMSLSLSLNAVIGRKLREQTNMYMNFPGGRREEQTNIHTRARLLFTPKWLFFYVSLLLRIQKNQPFIHNYIYLI